MWYDELAVGQASLARLVGVREVPDPEVDEMLEPDGRDLLVDDVRFGYRAGRDVLHGVDLVVSPGERLALVGPSGAGKSTLGRLLAGIYAPRTGRLELGGAALSRMAPERARTHVVLVNQEHHVFVGSVRDNLVLARADAGEADLWDALTGVDADRVGARAPCRARHRGRLRRCRPRTGAGPAARAGPTRSRRPAHPRARRGDLAARPPRRPPPRAITVGPARRAHRHRHRPPAPYAYDADRIAVVEDGLITELGSHTELVAAGGAYAALWASWRDAD